MSNGRALPSVAPRPGAEGTGAKLALFVSGLAGGGAQRRMITLANAFAERGHHVDLVVVRGRGPFRERVSPSVRIVALEPWAAGLPWVREVRGRWVITSTAALAGYLRREAPETMLSTSPPANQVALWARSLARSRVRLVINLNVSLSRAGLRTLRMDARAMLRLARRWYPSADAAIAISEGVAQELAGIIGVRSEKIATIYNPVATAEIEARAHDPIDHPWFAPGSPPVVLGVGKLKPQKDFATLMRAFARVRERRPARLMILGEGEKRRELEGLVGRLSLAPDVSLPGFVLNPYAFMSRAGVFVLPSVWEGFSNATAEALACGCAVVSTDCPSGPSEILDGGSYGRLVPVGDDAAMAEAIISALDRPPDRWRLRARAAEFSVDRAADQYLQVMLER